jgi:crotonobetainyl-CoA:carnitine CoA-transferase CaiB-like acyl-CoA transferase
MVGGPIIDAAAAAPHEAAPALGADAQSVLRDCGFSEPEIAQLRADGAI